MSLGKSKEKSEAAQEAHKIQSGMIRARSSLSLIHHMFAKIF